MIGLSDSKTNTTVEKLLSIEGGDTPPTQNQLRRMANAYHRPLVTLYLPDPPIAQDTGEDSRGLTPADIPNQRKAAHLKDLLSTLSARQSMILPLLEDNKDTQEPPFVGMIKNRNLNPKGTPPAVRKIHEVLSINPSLPE